MKASDLIDHLHVQIGKHGDLDIVTDADQSIEGVEYNSDFDDDVFVIIIEDEA